jgi:hypothetical protein
MKGYRTEYKQIEIYEICDSYVCFDVTVQFKLGIQEPHKGGALTCDSDADFFGYTEILEAECIEWTATGDDGVDLIDQYADELPAWVEKIAIEEAEIRL